MKVHNRKITPVFLALFTLLQSSSVMAQNDAALFKACPDLEAWAALHPHHDGDSGTGTSKTQGVVTLPKLRTELKQRVVADQRARKELFKGGGTPDKKALLVLGSVDQENYEWLKQAISEHGLPTTEQVGEDGVSDVFLLVQHADNYPEFQETVLNALLPRLTTGGIPKSEVAMLTDRVLISQGKLQRYGTQFSRAKDGTFTLKPTEDMTQLAERRKQVDLMPLPVYECVLQATYASQ